MFAIDLSPTQLIQLWMRLEDCYNGRDRYAGDTAEIYGYTLVDHSPCFAANPESKLAEDVHAKAWATLFLVLEHFERMRDCNIFVDDTRLVAMKVYFDGNPKMPFHRVKIRVEKS